jgi:hypothetical protein
VKRFLELVSEQRSTVTHLRDEATKYIITKITGNPAIIGALLTGSIARGDGRISPWGVYIDITLVLREHETIDLDSIFGKNEEPYIPKHCINLFDKVGVAIATIGFQDLLQIRTMPESNIFAMNESMIIADSDALLANWKTSTFSITDEQKKGRALQHYFRMDYLINDYRMEKWTYREAFVQIAQNFNEATECYLMFLYCINGCFIPRKDWLVYLSYELEWKPSTHDTDIQKVYTGGIGRKAQDDRRDTLMALAGWMLDFCKQKTWL